VTKVPTDTTHMERRTLAPPAFLGSLVLLLGLALCARSVSAQANTPRFEVGSVFSIYHAPSFSTPTQFELGGRFTWNWLPHLAVEGEYDSTLRSPVAATSFEGGYFSQGLFGIKSGVRWTNWGVFAKFRPGFIRYSDAISGVTVTPTSIILARQPLRDTGFDLGGGAEFFISRHFLFRYDASDLIVHQGAHGILFNGVTETFRPFTHNNFETEVSVAFRF